MNAFSEAISGTQPFRPEEPPKPEPAFIPRSGLDRGWHESEPEPRTWVVDGVIPQGRAGALVAPGGSGKSRLVTTLAVSITAGVQWFNFPISTPGAVLIVAGEDELSEIHRRILSSVRGLDQARQRLAWERIFVESRIGTKSLLTEQDSRSGEVHRTAFLEQLIESVNLINDIRLIVLDPISRFRGGSENEAEAATRFIEAAEALAGATGAAVLLVHHAGKGAVLNGQTGSQAASRGSSALVDGTRFCMNLSPLTPAESKKFGLTEDAARGYSRLTNSKNSYAPAFKDLILRMGGVISQSELEACSSCQGENQDALQKIKDIIRGKAKFNTRFTQSQFRAGFSGTKGELGLSDGKLRILLSEAVARGELVLRKKHGVGGGDLLYLPDEAAPSSDVYF